MTTFVECEVAELYLPMRIEGLPAVTVTPDMSTAAAAFAVLFCATQSEPIGSITTAPVPVSEEPAPKLTLLPVM